MNDSFHFGKGQYIRSNNVLKRNRLSPAELNGSEFDFSNTNSDEQQGLDLGFEYDTNCYEEEKDETTDLNFSFQQQKVEVDTDNTDPPHNMNDFFHVQFDTFLQGAKLIQGDIEEEV